MGEKVTLVMDEVRKTKAKESTYKHCTLLDKIVSHWKYRLIVLKLLYVYSGRKQLSNWMMNGGSQFSHIGLGGYRQANIGDRLE